MSATGKPGHGNKYARKREAAVEALLSCPTLRAAAKKAGVSEKTLRDWLKLPDFEKDFAAARQRYLGHALSRLQRDTGAAVTALRKALTCGDKGVAVRAAVSIIDRALKSNELFDVLEQLKEMQRQIKELQDGK